MICVNTNCLLINHHRGHLQIVCSSLCVDVSVRLPFHRNDCIVWTERTRLEQTPQGHTAGVKKMAKRSKKKKQQEEMKSEANESERESMHFTLMSNSYTFLVCLVFFSPSQ